MVARAQHERLVVTYALLPFNLDFISGRYVPNATAQLAGLVEVWRDELGADNFTVAEIGKSAQGYDIYHELSDSTLKGRVGQWLGMVTLSSELKDRFGVSPAMLDTLPIGRVLIVDRYQVAGQSELRHKTQSLAEQRRSQRYADHFEADELKVKQYLVEPITTVDTTITTRDCYFGSSAFARLFHTFQLEVTGADVSLFAPVALDATISQGGVNVRQLLGLFRYDNALMIARMTGHQLDSLLEKIYGMRYFTIRSEESDMVRLRVPYYLHDDAAGVRYRVDLTARSGARVTIYQTENGARFDSKARYSVALNSFRAKELDGMSGVEIDTVAGDYRVALIRWMSTQQVHRPRAGDNWSLGPEKWSSAIEKRERITIFEK